jgi:uncharacterized protein (DUF1499 family)
MSGPSRLAACPGSANCVSSDALDPAHAVAPFHVGPSGSDAWAATRAAVESLPRTTVVEETGTYLHAECRSAVFRFVDDLELEWRPAAGLVAVRSAARLGRYDFGVNRRRVERLRADLRARGALR